MHNDQILVGEEELLKDPLIRKSVLQQTSGCPINFLTVRFERTMRNLGEGDIFTPSPTPISSVIDFARLNKMLLNRSYIETHFQHHFCYTQNTLNFFEDNFHMETDVIEESIWDTKDRHLLKNGLLLKTRDVYSWSLEYLEKNTLYGRSFFESRDEVEILDIINNYLPEKSLSVDGAPINPVAIFDTRRLIFDCSGIRIYFDLSRFHQGVPINLCYAIGTIECYDITPGTSNLLDLIYNSNLELMYPVPTTGILFFKFDEIPEEILKAITYEKDPEFNQFKDLDVYVEDSSFEMLEEEAEALGIRPVEFCSKK